MTKVPRGQIRLPPSSLLQKAQLKSKNKRQNITNATAYVVLGDVVKYIFKIKTPFGFAQGVFLACFRVNICYPLDIFL